MTSRYKVEIGLNYRTAADSASEVRAEPGDIISDLPKDAIPHLLAINAISPVRESKTDDVAKKEGK